MTINSKIFRAYDIRGRCPEEINPAVVFEIGRALADYLSVDEIIVGRDARAFSKDLFESLSRAITQQGVGVIEIGETPSDVLCFCLGKFKKPGVMITASHLPAGYNGLKLYDRELNPIGQGSGLEELQELAAQGRFKKAGQPGRIKQKDVLAEYFEYLFSLIDQSSIKGLKVAVDAGNGMTAKTAPLVFERLKVETIPLYFELDMSFPNHPANPRDPANMSELRAKVRQTRADIGIAFDGDGDRVGFVDEKGGLVDNSLIIALLSEHILAKHPGGKVVYSLTSGRIVPETILKAGGQPVKERVGRSFIKQRINREKAVLGGETSGHYFFRDFFGADSGMLAALLVLEILAKQARPFSEIIIPFKKYFAIEETNFPVQDQGEVIKKMAEFFKDGQISYLDGVTVEYPDWWFNLRPSNTEPVSRLNLEAESEELMREKFNLISQLIKKRSLKKGQTFL